MTTAMVRRDENTKNGRATTTIVSLRAMIHMTSIRQKLQEASLTFTLVDRAHARSPRIFKPLLFPSFPPPFQFHLISQQHANGISRISRISRVVVRIRYSRFINLYKMILITIVQTLEPPTKTY